MQLGSSAFAAFARRSLASDAWVARRLTSRPRMAALPLTPGGEVVGKHHDLGCRLAPSRLHRPPPGTCTYGRCDRVLSQLRSVGRRYSRTARTRRLSWG